MNKSKTPCKYGEKCYRKNKKHLEEYSHPGDSDDASPVRKTSPPPKKRRKKDEDPPNKKTIADFFTKTTTPGGTKPDTDDTESAEPHTTKDNSGGTEELEDENNDKRDEATFPASPQDVKENIKQKFLMEMPDDFYAFWDLAKSINRESPNDALKKALGLELVGPYDICGEQHKKRKGHRVPCYLRHWRYYYDPPEFMTVIRGDDDSQFHMGYFRDDPKEMPAFVASNAASQNCTIAPRGENIFAAVSWFIDDFIKKNKNKKESLSRLKQQVIDAAQKGGFSLEAKTKAMKARDKKVNCRLFHGAGMVVPVDESGVGYREVPEAPGDLKKMFKKIAEADTAAARDAAFDPLMELIMLIQFANDECDYGEGLELGLNLFSYGGEVFHSNVLKLASLAYELLGRHEYKEILEAHLKDRRQALPLSQIA